MTDKELDLSNPFTILNNINTSTENLLRDNEAGIEVYSSYMINRGLSLFQDSVLLADEMNRAHELNNLLQYEFYLHGLRKRKRFSKWPKKKNKDEDIAFISDFYKYNTRRAEEALSLLDENQLEELKKTRMKGGV